MSWSIGLHIGEAFAEITGHKDGVFHHDRWLLPSQSLVKGLQSFAAQFGIEKPSTVFLSDHFIQQILSKRLGSSPAFLVTNGFENWLEMSLPVQPDYFTVRPYKLKSPLSRDLTFGISERTNAQGEIERPVDISELEFLATKLELSQVKAVAVGLLHSNKNPENELKVANFFRERGFRVFTSLLSDHEGLNERERWWRSILNAYVSSSLEDLRKSAREQIAQVFGEDVGINGVNFEEGSLEPDYLATMNHAQSTLIESLPDSFDHLLYLGLENFYCMDLKTPHLKKWLSDWGWVAGKQISTYPLNLQPTQRISKSFWGFAAFDSSAAGYEPGPMCLGKGLNALFLDVLYELGFLSEVPGLNERLQEKTKARIRESLLTYVREQEFVVQADEIAGLLRESAATNLILQIEHLCEDRKVILAGPLAKDIFKLLKPHLGKLKIELATPHDFLLSKALVGTPT